MAPWQDTLISISFVYGPRRRADPGDNASGPRFLSLPVRTAGGKGAGPALRRGAAPCRPDQRAILAADVSEPAGTARDDASGVAAGDGSDYVDGRPQALAAPRPGPGRGRPSGPSRATDGAHRKGTKGTGPRRSNLEKDPRCCRSASPRWRRRSASEQSTHALLIVPWGWPYCTASRKRLINPGRSPKI
jgi:hypothetical protein